MKSRHVFALFIVPFAATCAAATCDRLTALTDPNFSVIFAVNRPAGPFELEGPNGSTQSIQLRAFCRVMAVARPVPDSEIHFEVWLPAVDTWNGRFEGTGNGGFSNAIGYRAMAQALAAGYATAGSDTGHTEGDTPKFAIGHPE